MSDADLLREAARLMRERAGATREPDPHAGQWYGSDGDDEDLDALTDALAERFNTSTARADAEHIASWHPAVALAVADWLETVDKRHQRSESHVISVSDDFGNTWTDVAIETPDGGVISTEPPEIACSHDPRGSAWPCPDRDAAVKVALVYLGENA